VNRALVAIPLVFIVVITVVDIHMPPHIHLGPLLVAAPIFTAMFAGSPLTGSVGALALAGQAIIAVFRGKGDGVLATENHVAQMIALALITILIVAFCVVREHCMPVAEAVMRTLLQPVPHQVGHVWAAGLYRPAEPGTMVGGDLYDIRATRAGERAVIGDVRGKGLQAVRVVADVLGSFRQAIYERGDLRQVAASMERSIALEAEAICDDELFLTAALIEYDAFAQRVTIVNHGHLEPLLISGGKVDALIGPSALPFGLGALTAELPVAYTHRLVRGDVLLLCTDGLSEARNPTGDFYPLIDRLRDRFADKPAPDPIDVIDFLNTDLPRHAHACLDDVAVLAIAPHGQI
jgi:hypothetical protein